MSKSVVLGAASAETVERIVKQHGNTVYKLAYRITGSHPDAQDVLQTVFFRLFQSWVRVSGVKNMKGWLIRTTTNASIDVLRGRKNKAVHMEGNALDQYVSSREKPECPMEKDELDEVVKDSLAKLPPRQRAALTLYDMEGLKSKEVGSILGISETAVRSYVFEARGRMRNYLRPYLQGRSI